MINERELNSNFKTLELIERITPKQTDNSYFSFGEIEDTLKRYLFMIDGLGEYIAYDRDTLEECCDTTTIKRLQFGLAWFKAARIESTNCSESNNEFQGAFSHDARILYDKVMVMIQQQITTNGNIDPISILEAQKNQRDYDIILGLFSTPRYAKAVTEYFRNGTINVLPQTADTLTLDERLLNPEQNRRLI